MYIHYENKKIHCKLAFIGPEGCGKTENLRFIYRSLSHDLKDGRLKLGPPWNIPQFFEFMPLSLGKVCEYEVKLHLYSFPPRFFYARLSDVLTKGLDGYIFIADSKITAMENNLSTMAYFKTLFEKAGLGDLPHVIQYNKRDQEGVVPTSILREHLNTSQAPDIETIALQGVGVMDALIAMTKIVLRRLAPTYA